MGFARFSQAQYADLRIETRREKKTELEVTVSLKDGFKVKSQDGSFQAQLGALLRRND